MVCSLAKSVILMVHGYYRAGYFAKYKFSVNVRIMSSRLFCLKYQFFTKEMNGGNSKIPNDKMVILQKILWPKMVKLKMFYMDMK